MVAALTRIFGTHNLALAEDVVQDAFCRAVEVWKVRGIPENPSAWLMATAKNPALDLVRREQTARTFAPELESERTTHAIVDEAFAEHAIREEQLRMMFSCCHPRLPEEVHVALILIILCGFGASEIASAFLSGRAAIEKRIQRAKKVLAGAKRLFDLADSEFAARLSAVRRALYLLFNEGYPGASGEDAVRAELCTEAMRLTALLREHPLAATPETNALAALMALHAARLPARVDAAGELNALLDQDRSLWDTRLLAEGLDLLERSAAGTELTAYHIEAAINRAIAVAERGGAERGLAELHAIADRDRLASYPFYPAALGELELRLGHREAALMHFQEAFGLARNRAERRFLDKRLRRCDAV